MTISYIRFKILQEADAKALQDKIAQKKAKEEAIARGDLVVEEKKVPAKKKYWFNFDINLQSQIVI